jgi:hypothetical protein
MSGAAARRRASIVISFGLQAAMIAALLAVLAPDSAPRPQAVQAVPQPSSAPPSSAPPAPATLAPAPGVYPMRLSLLMHIGGGEHVVTLPQGWAEPPELVYVPLGRTEKVTVAVANPGPGTATSAWFAIAPSSVLDDQVTQLGISLGSTFWVEARASELRPGVSRFMFTVPAADLQPGSFPVIVMGAQEGYHQVTYGLVQLDPSGRAG